VVEHPAEVTVAGMLGWRALSETFAEERVRQVSIPVVLTIDHELEARSIHSGRHLEGTA
jgi:hypothetical protein